MAKRCVAFWAYGITVSACGIASIRRTCLTLHSFTTLHLNDCHNVGTDRHIYMTSPFNSSG